MTQYDVIIPYWDKQTDHSDLNIALASLRKFAVGLRCIWLVTANPTLSLDDLSDVNAIYCTDVYQHCKDANLIRKTISALDSGAGRLSMKENIPVVWMNDDNALLRPVNVAEKPWVCNGRMATEFSPTDTSKWRRRMAKTFKELEKIGKPQKYNYDAHCPQRYDRNQLLNALLNAPEDNDVCFNTWCVGYISGVDAHEGTASQSDVKITIENSGPVNANFDKYDYLGWNDEGKKAAHEIMKKRLSDA